MRLFLLSPLALTADTTASILFEPVLFSVVDVGIFASDLVYSLHDLENKEQGKQKVVLY